MKQSPRWMRLDNAAKIYPAAKKRNWSALFRLSATLDEAVDPDTLRRALARTLPRFPAFAVRMKTGMFWYYLEHAEGAPPVQEDSCCPCPVLRLKANGGFGLRVRYYGCRIAVEFFHVLTDGTGGISFLKTLVAEYLTLRYGATVPRGGDILDCSAPALPEEIEDSFLAHAGPVASGRSEKKAYRVRGTPNRGGFVTVTCGDIPVDRLRDKAREKGVSITQYLTAVLILAIDDIQRQENHPARKLKPVKICVPINLRRFFKSRTTRNFASYVNPGIEPRMGEYTLDEVLSCVYHHMGLEITEKKLSAKFTANVRSEKNALLRVTPLFIKKPIMKMAFHIAGDRKTSSTLSNLGQVHLPPEMAEHVGQMDFILGPLSINPVACAALSYNGRLHINITRTIAEPKVERAFFTRLFKLGIPVKVESNAKVQGE
nr:hypothetical protein [bacterium]